MSFNGKWRRPFSMKGWLEVELMLSKGCQPLKLVNTHLEHKKEDFKCQQLHELFRNVLEPDRMGAIICGDFNTSPNIPEFTASYYEFTTLIAKHGLIDLFPGPEATYRNEIKKKSRTKIKSLKFAVDHMLLSKDLFKYVVSGSTGIVEYKESRNGEYFYASDHKGIRFTLDTTGLEGQPM